MVNLSGDCAWAWGVLKTGNMCELLDTVFMRPMRGEGRTGESREDKAKPRFDVVVRVCSCVRSRVCVRV